MGATLAQRASAKSKAQGVTRLVIVNIALAANKRGHAQLTYAELAHLCSCSEKQVQRGIAELLKLGEVEIFRRGNGRGRPAIYSVWFSAVGTEFPLRRVDYSED